MPGLLLGGRPSLAAPYGPAMKKHSTVAPRNAAIDAQDARREGRAATKRRTGLAAAAAGTLLAIALGACSPGGAGTPIPISSALPNVNPSAVASMAAGAASAAAGAAVAALDQVDAAITANQTATGLTADDVAALKQLTAGVRTALQSGDMTGAKTAVDNLSTKVDSFAAKLNTDVGKQLTVALAALKAALPAS
jgi:hypothetical protein